jgi:tetratricopeptide (TPR) repeat protein
MKQIVLFLSATPSNQEELKIIEAFKDIQAKVNSANYNEQFDCRPENKVSIDEMQTCLWKEKPQIVHFFGHGEKGYLMLQNANGEVEEAKLKPFADMFRVLNNRGGITKEQRIRCAVLCACSSGKIAEAISKHVEFAIGTVAPISEQSARIFAKTFYFHLCSGDSLQDAFDMANSQVSFWNQDENKVFKIYCSGANPQNVFFIKSNEKPSPTQTLKEKTPDDNTVVVVQPPEQTDTFDDALDSLNIGNYQQAIFQFDAYLQRNPTNDKAWVGKGNSYRKLAEKARKNLGGKAETEYESALASYNNALKYNSKNTEAWLNKADCLEYLAYCRDANLFDEIKNCYDNAIRINSRLFEAYNHKGFFYIREYNGGHQTNKEILMEAVEIFNEALKLNPNYTENWYGKASALEAQYRYTQNPQVIRDAIECLENALQIDPSYNLAKRMRDNLFQKLHEMQQPTQPQQPPRQVQPPPPPVQVDYLVGRWFFPNGNFWEFVRQGNEYYVMEITPMGRIAEGRAAINGNNVYVSMNAYNGIHYEANVFMNGNIMQGTGNIMGMIQPVMLCRGR